MFYENRWILNHPVLLIICFLTAVRKGEPSGTDFKGALSEFFCLIFQGEPLHRGLNKNLQLFLRLSVL